MPVKLHLTFNSQAALQAFLARHPNIEDGIVACTPTPVPPPGGTTPPNQPPVASLVPLSGQTVAQIWTFSTEQTADPDGTIGRTIIAWGDGSAPYDVPSAPAPQVTHQFLTAGTVTIRMTVIDNGGLSQTQEITVQVLVAPVAPVAALTFVSGTFTGSPVTVSTAGTQDVDGSIASWFITWGDGGPSDGGVGAPPATLQHTYSGAGTFPAVLTVTDTTGLQGTATLPILVQAPTPGNPPVTTLALTSGTTLGDTFAFALTGTDPEAGALTWSLDYGDSTAPATGTGATLPSTQTHVYAAAGSYTVVFRVTDPEGLTTTKSLTVSVGAPPPDPIPENQSPLVSLAVQAGQFTGDPYTFTLGAIDEDGSVASWSFAAGDGTAAVGGAGQPPLSLVHTYALPGTFNALLTVVDNGGLTGTASLTVVVQSPPASNQPPSVTLSKLGGTTVGDTFTFAVSASDPDGSIASWIFSAGDGSAPVSGSGTPPTTRTHVYTVAGTYTASLQVTDNGGLTRTATTSVGVSTPTPNPGSYPYYDSLVARSDRRFAFPLRSQAELDSYRTVATWAPVGSVFYDAGVDACQQFIDPQNILGPSGVPGTGNQPRQKIIPIVIPAGMSFLQTWDSRYTSGWAWVNDNYIRNQKSYRWDLPAGQPGPSYWFDMKHFWREGQAHGDLALYGCQAGTSGYYLIPPSTKGSLELLLPQTLFYIRADRWIRTWIYYDAPAQQLSCWMADPVQGIVQVLNQNGWGFPPSGIIEWRLCYDTSQNTFSAQNPLSRIWNRNIVVLQNLSYATAQSLLSLQALPTTTP